VDKVHHKLTLQLYAVSRSSDPYSKSGVVDVVQRKRIDRSGAFAKNRKALSSFENGVHNLKRLSHYHLVEFFG
jgi:hypothetical protein